MILSQPHASNFCGYLARNDNICMDHTFPNNPAKKLFANTIDKGDKLTMVGACFMRFFSMK